MPTMTGASPNGLAAGAVGIAMVVAVAGTLVSEAAAQRRCPDETSVGANQPCGRQTETAKKGGKAAGSVGGLKMEQDIVEKPRKKPGKIKVGN